MPCDITITQHFVRWALFPHLPPFSKQKSPLLFPFGRSSFMLCRRLAGCWPIQMFPLSALFFLPLLPTKYHLLNAFTMIVHLSQQLFDAIDILIDKLLLNEWIGSIVLNYIPVMKSMVGKHLPVESLQVDICHFLGSSTSPLLSLVDHL
jgi:hypothetical protein